MKSRWAVTLILLAMLAPGCSSVPTKDIQVNALADSKVDLSGYKTYGWLVNAAILNDAYGQWEPPAFDADAEVKYLIDRELRKRGMSENSADPDVIVAFAAGINMDALRLRDGPTGRMSVQNIPRGGLTILFVGSQTGVILWMGVATGDIQDSPDTETAKARLDYAVTRILKQLPR